MENEKIIENYLSYDGLFKIVDTLYRVHSLDPEDALKLEITLPMKAYDTLQDSLNNVASPVFLTEEVVSKPYHFSKILLPTNIQIDLKRANCFTIKKLN